MIYVLGVMVLFSVGSLIYSIYYSCSDKGKKAKVYN